MMMDFPVVGPKVLTWTLTEYQLGEFRENYPQVNVDIELQKARGWLLGNPQRRKTSRGMLRFLTGWFNRAVDDLEAERRRLAPKALRPHWTEECKREHGLRCIHQSEHRIRMYQQRERANGETVAEG